MTEKEQNNPLIQANARDLERELDWFRRVLDTRLKLYFGNESEHADIYEIEPPVPGESTSNWARLLNTYQPSFDERLALILALVPHLEPQMLDVFFNKNILYDRLFTEFGGVLGGLHRGFVPSGETLLFLLGAGRLDRRLAAKRLFHPDHFLIRDDILTLQKTATGEPPFSGALALSPEYAAALTHGLPPRPVFGQDFPAEAIETALEWDDLILNAATRAQIAEIQTWIEHGQTLLNDWQMSGKIRPGFRALFHGPPGTGKTLTACLLGKSTGRQVYRVDLSMVVSKYIGETEKNLSNVFRHAENKNWILFFDEADTLFGKRTETKSAHDRYANQEVAYLLQRVERFDGVVILASNFKENIDKAFTRRFETFIYFPMPKPEERLRIWQKGFSARATLAPDLKLDLEAIARQFEISGANVMNAIRYASLEALREGSGTVTLAAVQAGIRKELIKEGKST